MTSSQLQLCLLKQPLKTQTKEKKNYVQGEMVNSLWGVFQGVIVTIQTFSGAKDNVL